MARRESALLIALALLAGVLTPGCAGSEETVLQGFLEREAIEQAVPTWVDSEIRATPDPAASLELEAALRGARVTVYLGTWCSDSEREVARLWRAMDEGGLVQPQEIRYVGVDRKKKKPRDLLQGVGLEFVPTFVVERDGVEVGRIVERSLGGIERDLLALLTGEKSGLLTARADLVMRAAANENR